MRDLWIYPWEINKDKLRDHTDVQYLNLTASLHPDCQHLHWLSVFSGAMDQGRLDHGSQSFGGNGNSGPSGNVTHRECT